MYKVPLLLVGIALVVNVIKHSGARDEVGGIVVDIQSGRVQQAAHGVHLRKPAGLRPSRFEELRDRRSGDLLLQDALLRDIRRQQPRHRDAELPQRFIVAELRLQLVA